jgi:hypothetical protein
METKYKKHIKALVESLIKEYGEGETFQQELNRITSGEKVYHRPMDSNTRDTYKIINSLFKRGFSREYTGDNGGNLYGPGVYNVYNLRSSNEKARGYGKFIVQSYVVDGYKDFLIFNKDIAKKYYGEDYWIGKQIKKLMPPKVANRVLYHLGKSLYMNDNNTENSIKTSEIALAIIRLLNKNLESTSVRGIIYSGNHDGCCAFVRDFTAVVPYSYSSDNGRTWKIGVNGELVAHLMGNIDTDFELKGRLDNEGEKMYDDVARKSVNGFALVFKNNKVNYYSVKTKNLISDVWFDEGVNFDEDGYADVRYKGINLSLHNENGNIIVTDTDGIELCTLEELPQMAENN